MEFGVILGLSSGSADVQVGDRRGLDERKGIMVNPPRAGSLAFGTVAILFSEDDLRL